MMQFQTKIVIGETEYIISGEFESHSEFFKKAGFFSQLPKVGPNNETDLVIQHRVAQKQYDYYSIVSKKANMEFKFGQSKDAKGSLFAKGWEPLFQGDGSEDGAEGEASHAAASVGVGGLGAPAAQAAPAAKAAAPAVGLGSLTAGLGATKAATPAAAPAASAPAAASPAVQNSAKNVLAKFGI